MKQIFLILLLLSSFFINAQEDYFKQPIETRGNIINKKIMYCSVLDTVTGEVYFKKAYRLEMLTKYQIKKLQTQLQILGYPIVITSILDLQTKLQLKEFNKKNNISKSSTLYAETKNLLREKSKLKMKQLK